MAKRLLELEPTGLFGEAAILTAITGREEMSKPYEFMLTINSPNDKIKPEDVIGKPLAVRIDRDQGQPRYIHVTSVTCGLATSACRSRRSRLLLELIACGWCHGCGS